MNEDSALDVEVAVVGAGLAGLTAATVAARAGASVLVLDVRSQGGRARSGHRDGYVFNQGPHALSRTGPGAAVLGRLGIAMDGEPPNPVVTGYRAETDELAVLPTSARSLLRSRLLSVGDKVRLGRLLAGLSKLDALPLARLSAADWIGSLGLRPGGSAVLSTLTRVATYAGDLGLVSADAAVGQLQLALVGNVVYLHGGWQTLVVGLVDALSAAGARLSTGERVVAVRPGATGTWHVVTQVRTVRARSVVVAVGGPDGARSTLPGTPDWDLGEPATAACLDLGLRSLPATPVAFGLDEPLYCSTHCPSARLAPVGGSLVHLLRYGARTSAEDRAALWSLARRCGIAEHDVVVERFLHAMTVCHALPRPGTGLAGRPSIAATGLEGVFLAGDWVGPVGLLADAALASGEAAGRAAVERSMRAMPAVGGMVGR